MPKLPKDFAALIYVHLGLLAAAFGAAGVILAAGCGDPLYRKAIRVSMGGSLRVPFASTTVWPADVARLRSVAFVMKAGVVYKQP